MADENINQNQGNQSASDLEEVTMESTTSELIKTDILQQSSMAPKEPEEKTKKSKKKLKLDIFLIIAVVALFISAGSGLFAYLELENIAANNRELHQEIATKNLTPIHGKLYAQSIRLRKSFESISKELSVNPEVFFQDSQLIQEMAESFYPDSELSYVTLPIDPEAIIENPAQGYAYLDILNSLLDEDGKQNLSKFEILKPKSKEAKAILVSLVKDQQEQPKGYIIIQSPTQILSQILKDVDTFGGEVLLKQGKAGSIRLRSIGQMPSDKVTASRALKDTSWDIEHHYPNDQYKFSFDLFLICIIYASVALIFLLIAIILISLTVKKQLDSKRMKKKEAQKEESERVESLQALSTQGQNNVSLVKEKDSLINNDTDKQDSIIEPGKIPDSIFLNYDIRGIVDYNLNAEVYHLLGKAIGNEMDDMERGEIVVGCDGRNSSPEYLKAIIEGMVKNGLKVYNLGVVPTPLLYYAAMEKTHGNGVMVTASHNPKNHNGLKVLLDGEIYHQDKLKSLQNKTDDNDLVDPGSTEVLDLKHEYIEKLSYLVSSNKKFKVAVDCGNGTAGTIIIELLEKMGCQVIPLFAEVDGNFPNHHPDPTRTENLQDLINAVLKNKADLGMAFDGDGDRLGVISSAGEIIWMDRLLMLMAKDVLSRNPKARVLYDVKSSSALHEWIIQHGGEPEMCPSGHSNVKERMKVSGAILAAELSGHMFIKENWYAFDDPYYAALKILEILSKDGRNSQKVFAELPDKMNTPEILIPVQPGQAEEIMQKIMAEKDEFEGAGLVLIDGLRAEYEDGWGLVRTSKTSSQLTLRFEADNPAALQRIAEKFKEVVLSVVFVKFPY